MTVHRPPNEGHETRPWRWVDSATRDSFMVPAWAYWLGWALLVGGPVAVCWWWTP